MVQSTRRDRSGLSRPASGMRRPPTSIRGQSTPIIRRRPAGRDRDCVGQSIDGPHQRPPDRQRQAAARSSIAARWWLPAEQRVGERRSASFASTEGASTVIADHPRPAAPVQTLTLDRDESDGGVRDRQRADLRPRRRRPAVRSPRHRRIGTRNGQGGYQLRTHGGRVPIQWLVSPDGWGMYIHQPLGAFDLTGSLGRLTPSSDALAARRLRRRIATIRR